MGVCKHGGTYASARENSRRFRVQHWLTSSRHNTLKRRPKPACLYSTTIYQYRSVCSLRSGCGPFLEAAATAATICPERLLRVVVMRRFLTDYNKKDMGDVMHPDLRCRGYKV